MPSPIRMAFLPAEAFDFGNGHAFHTDFGKRLFYFLQLKGFNDSNDEFHGVIIEPSVALISCQSKKTFQAKVLRLADPISGKAQ